LPKEVVTLAKRTGLRALSITDHDTVEGLEFARRECEKQNIDLIAGIELTTEMEFSNIEIHILGYDIDPDDYSLLKLTDHAKENARNYSRKVCSALESFGWEIDYYIIDSSKGIITKHDITRSVVNKNVSNYDFHINWLSEKSPIDTVMQKLSAKRQSKQ
jgi:hypothetical protein